MNYKNKQQIPRLAALTAVSAALVHAHVLAASPASGATPASSEQWIAKVSGAQECDTTLPQANGNRVGLHKKLDGFYRMTLEYATPDLRQGQTYTVIVNRGGLTEKFTIPAESNRILVLPYKKLQDISSPNTIRITVNGTDTFIIPNTDSGIASLLMCQQVSPNIGDTSYHADTVLRTNLPQMEETPAEPEADLALNENVLLPGVAPAPPINTDVAPPAEAAPAEAAEATAEISAAAENAPAEDSADEVAPPALVEEAAAEEPVPADVPTDVPAEEAPAKAADAAADINEAADAAAAPEFTAQTASAGRPDAAAMEAEYKQNAGKEPAVTEATGTEATPAADENITAVTPPVSAPDALPDPALAAGAATGAAVAAGAAMASADGTEASSAETSVAASDIEKDYKTFAETGVAPPPARPVTSPAKQADRLVGEAAYMDDKLNQASAPPAAESVVANSNDPTKSIVYPQLPEANGRPSDHSAREQAELQSSLLRKIQLLEREKETLRRQLQSYKTGRLSKIRVSTGQNGEPTQADSPYGAGQQKVLPKLPVDAEGNPLPSAADAAAPATNNTGLSAAQQAEQAEKEIAGK